MNFIDAVKTCLNKYADFDGRASRSEFWWFALAAWIVNLLSEAIAIQVLIIVISLALIIPQLAVGSRRLHDTGRSAWWLLLYLIPIVGWIWLIVLYCQPSQIGYNEYGADPIEGQY